MPEIDQAIHLALQENVPGEITLENKQEILQAFKDIMGDSLYFYLIEKYNLGHIFGNNKTELCVSDIRALLVGMVTNVEADDLQNNIKLKEFIKKYNVNIQEMAKAQRKTLADAMDKLILKQKNPFIRFTLRIGKKITDRLKVADLKDAFSGVQINVAFEDDIKTVVTVQHAQTYQDPAIINSIELREAIPDLNERKRLASGLYLGSDLAYRNLNDGTLIPILDKDGQQRLYRVHNIVKANRLVCTALVPYVESRAFKEPLDIKILFRGTYSTGTMDADLETTGAGSKTMRDNRIKLLDEVNNLVQELQNETHGKEISLSVHGHSLGGSFAERFVSELHQGIFYQECKKKKSLEFIQHAMGDVDEKTLKQIRKQMALNEQEMFGKHYSGLSSLTSITMTSANSARLIRKEAKIGEAFILLTRQQYFENDKEAPVLQLDHFKSKGDPVSKAGRQALGAGLVFRPWMNVTILLKKTGYSFFDAAVTHAEHPFQTRSGTVFSYEKNGDDSAKWLKRELTSGNRVVRAIQKVYEKTPMPIAEPITWIKRKMAKIRGDDPLKIKTYAVKMESEKEKRRRYKKR